MESYCTKVTTDSARMACLFGAGAQERGRVAYVIASLHALPVMQLFHEMISAIFAMANAGLKRAVWAEGAMLPAIPADELLSFCSVWHLFLSFPPCSCSCSIQILNSK